MNNSLNILVTASGTQTMPGLVDCFHFNGERNIRVIGVDASVDETLKQVVDASYQVPRVDDPGYLDSLIDICIRESIDVFFPFMDEELDLINDSISRFNSIGVRTAIPSKRIINITNNKLSFYRWMQDNGLPVPEFCMIKSVDDIESACKKLGYPEKNVCIKSLNASGSRGIRILDEKVDLYGIFLNEKPSSMITDLDSFMKMCNKTNMFTDMMAMEYLPGEECSVDILSENGRVLYMVGRAEEDVLASTPQSCKLMYIPEAYRIAEAVAYELGLDGNADFDFKYNSKGEPVLMEVNPRIAATMSVIAIGGINLPYLRVKQLLGEDLPVIEPHYGVKMTRRYTEYFADEKGERISWKRF